MSRLAPVWARIYRDAFPCFLNYKQRTAQNANCQVPDLGVQSVRKNK